MDNTTTTEQQKAKINQKYRAVNNREIAPHKFVQTNMTTFLLCIARWKSFLVKKNYDTVVDVEK